MEIFSEYLKREDYLSRIDVRIKLITGLILLMMVLSHRGIVFPLFIAILCLTMCLSIKIPLRIYLMRFTESLFIAGVLFIIKSFSSGKEILCSFHAMGMDINIYRDGLTDGLILSTRIIGAVSIVALIGFTTPFTELISGLSWFRVPKVLIEILIFAHRYIFVLLEDAMVIYNAQKNRLGYSNILRGLISFGNLTGSLIIKAFEHSEKITTSMVQRGYNGYIPVLRQRPFRMREVILSILFLTLAGILWKI